MSAFERSTPRLRLRRPTSADLAAHVRLHTDPRTYAHAPHTMPDVEACAARLAHDVEHWAEHGYGYAAVEDRDTGEVVGWAGAKVCAGGELNAYWRLAHDRLGRGLGAELARAVVEAALEEAPQRELLASVAPTNPASLAAARAAGFVPVGHQPEPRDPPGSPPHVLLGAPRLVTPSGHAGIDDATAADVVDLWLAVTEAGGAVGFLPGAPRTDVERELDRLRAAIGSGSAVVGLLRDAHGGLLGVGFWEREDWWGHRHLALLKRLMVRPDRHRKGTGRQLMAGMHGLARRLPDVELCRLTYRSGLGVGEFYAGLGWTEVGRFPGGLRVSREDRRDEVEMARRVDGGPLLFDGRT